MFPDSRLTGSGKERIGSCAPIHGAAAATMTTAGEKPLFFPTIGIHPLFIRLFRLSAVNRWRSFPWVHSERARQQKTF